MRCIIGFGQVAKVQPGIDLRRADVGVPQQLLHTAQVTAGLQHMTGHGVAQHVRVHWRGQPGL